MTRPTWNVWSCLVILALFGSGLYLSRHAQVELAGTLFAGGIALAGVTERKRP